MRAFDWLINYKFKSLGKWFYSSDSKPRWEPPETEFGSRIMPTATTLTGVLQIPKEDYSTKYFKVNGVIKKIPCTVKANDVIEFVRLRELDKVNDLPKNSPDTNKRNQGGAKG